jgi:hypothetical protein
VKPVVLAAVSAMLAAAAVTALPAAGIAPQASADDCPMCDTPNVQFFMSPSGNISCQMNFRRPMSSIDPSRGYSPDGAYCATGTPPQSVSIGSDGSLRRVCTADQSYEPCVGNAPVGQPTLPYGASKTLGPFTCMSETTGMTCVVTASGRGFTISGNGIVPVG